MLPLLPSAAPDCIPPTPSAGTFFAILLVVYLLYSLPMSYIKHNRDVHFSDTDGQLK